ncbi:MAG: FAD:protein FMN transferase, partial [Actinomycetes bacterium]
HIIDPRTGQPGGDGLQAVTVVGPDPAEAEVWSKSLFLAGASGIGEVAAQNNLAALWVTDDDHLGVSSAMEQFVIWQRPDVETSP